jgi:hypothetical protein
VAIAAPALGDPQFACVLAFAPNVHPVISALGALVGEVPCIVPPHALTSPAFADAMRSLISTVMNGRVLQTWASAAQSGCGAAHAADVINVVQNERCEPWVAAALIGPCDTSAALLDNSWDISLAVQRWGEATPDHPTAWKNALTPAERDRLLDALRHAPNAAARCLPWLPKADASNIVGRIKRKYLPLALGAYVAASPIARAHHVGILSTLIQRDDTDAITELTRLAVATGMDDAWAAVVRILSANPWSAIDVVTAALWNDLPANVQTLILSADDPNDVCAAIAFARGERSDPPAMTPDTAFAFFAAVTPEIWDALPMKKKRTWLRRLSVANAHLAVRSLGPDPVFLAHAYLDKSLTTAVRRHAPDERTMRRILLPVAVRDLPSDAIPAVITTLSPPDLATFAQIAGRMPEMSPVLRDWFTMHPTVQAAATAATALRVATRSLTESVAARCAALAAAFAGWSSEEATVLLAALPDDVVVALRPNVDTLANTLAHPNRRDAFRQALDAINSLPPATTRPALLALGVLASASDLGLRIQAGRALAHVLRDHGDCFLTLVDALADVPRTAILPLPQSGRRAAAVRAIAAADPLVAHHLAHALQSRSPTAMLDALTDAPFDALARIWGLLPKDLQQSVPGDRDTLIHGVAAPERANDLAFVLRAWNVDDPLVLLALRLLIDDDVRRQERGVAILAQHPDMAASLLPLLREDLRALLVRNPRIVVAGADLPPPSASVRRRRR